MQGHDSPVGHGLYVWREYVLPAEAKKIAIVAHSFGGTEPAAMLTENNQHFRDRVLAIALTDSHPRCEGEAGKLLEKVGALE